jgi:hypothetical protein
MAISGLIGEMLQGLRDNFIATIPSMASNVVNPEDVDWVVVKEYLGLAEEAIEKVLEVYTEKAGARHSKPDQSNVQSIHDAAVQLGASCPMMIFKQANGSYRWVTFSSTAYEDRDREIVSRKAQESDCEELDRTKEYGPLRWWHLGKPVAMKEGDWRSYVAGNGVDLGACDFSAMQGRVRVESGTFYDERVGASLKDHTDDLSVSIGYSHPSDEPKGGVFDNIHTFERSLLPLGKQSNYFASILTITKESKMNDEKKKALRVLIGDKAADAILGKADQTDKAAEAIGIAFKQAEVDPPEPDADDKEKDKGKGKKKFGDMDESEMKEFIKKCIADQGTEDKAKSAKEAQELTVTLESIQTGLKAAAENDTKIANALTTINASLKANSESIKALQGDLPKSLAHLKRSAAEDNVIPDATAKQFAPAQQTKDGLGGFLDFAVSGGANGKTPPAG